VLPEKEMIEAALARYKQAVKILDHERAAVSDPDHILLLMAQVDTVSTKLYKQLVAWHTQFPEKPTREESDMFWKELKELRMSQEELRSALAAIRDQEKKTPTLTTQIESTQETITDIESYFDAYLDRVHER
jgi:hypothetical protein